MFLFPGLPPSAYDLNIPAQQPRHLCSVMNRSCFSCSAPFGLYSLYFCFTHSHLLKCRNKWQINRCVSFKKDFSKILLLSWFISSFPGLCHAFYTHFWLWWWPTSISSPYQFNFTNNTFTYLKPLRNIPLTASMTSLLLYKRWSVSSLSCPLGLGLCYCIPSDVCVVADWTDVLIYL